MSEYRDAIIKVLDETDDWQHVIMNYLFYAPYITERKNKKIRLLCERLNKAIDFTMLSYDDLWNRR